MTTGVPQYTREHSSAPHTRWWEGRVAALLQELVGTLCNRRYTEKSVAYAESHDQAIVGDQTIGETHQGYAALVHLSMHFVARQHLLD